MAKGVANYSFNVYLSSWLGIQGSLAAELGRRRKKEKRKIKRIINRKASVD